MKRVLYCIVIAYLQYISLSYGWEAHVIPVYKDARTNQWSGLFGHNTYYGWSDFKQSFSKQKKAPHSAAQALNKQTNGAFNITVEQIKKIKSYTQLANGDRAYFVPVKYVSAPNLHKKMNETVECDITNDKFVWLSMDEVFRHRTVVKLARGKTSLFVFDYTIRNLIKENWYSKILPELNAATAPGPINAQRKEELKRLLFARQEFVSSRMKRPAPKVAIKQDPLTRSLNRAAKIRRPGRSAA